MTTPHEGSQPEPREQLKRLDSEKINQTTVRRELAFNLSRLRTTVRAAGIDAVLGAKAR